MAVNQVDAALALPAGETGAALLALPEDQWFARKSVRILPRDLGSALTAFANAEGGTIVIGLRDGQIEGASSGSSTRCGSPALLNPCTSRPVQASASSSPGASQPDPSVRPGCLLALLRDAAPANRLIPGDDVRIGPPVMQCHHTRLDDLQGTEQPPDLILAAQRGLLVDQLVSLTDDLTHRLCLDVAGRMRDHQEAAGHGGTHQPGHDLLRLLVIRDEVQHR